ncbi:uncharacterized protein RB166_018905 isoform 1-T2 [Leptodactylus fuscus]|uniref:uncharacterized protein LOC142182754 n=1 Tax=Leptodactylus fuscus TaxID=238119 RepID=UPI003F4E5DB5
MEERQRTDKILTLTLEIIYLLTGEDYTVVKKTSDKYVTPSNLPHVSGGWSRSRSPIMEPSPHSLIPESNNEQKILELTKKMICLLTGEVPVRCQDVTVYFSMEEWEYLEGHKDLYKEVMMDDHQTLTSPGVSKVSTTKHPPVQIKEELASCDRGNLEDTEVYTLTDHTQDLTPHIKPEMASCGEGNIEDLFNYSPTDHIQLHSPSHVKEEPDPIVCTQYPSAHTIDQVASQDGGPFTITNTYTSPDHTQLYTKEDPDSDIYTQNPPHRMEESVSCAGGNSAVTNLGPSSDCTHRYPSPHRMEEPVTGNLSDSIIDTPQYPSTHITGEPVSYSGTDPSGTNTYSSMDQRVPFVGDDVYKNSGYIFTEHTYTHHTKNTFNLGTERLVEEFMNALPHVVGASTSMEGFSTEAGLAEIQYVSNHVRSPDWCPTKAKRHDVFLSKCIEYENHLCQVSRARICGTHLTEWSVNCSECQNCLNATLKLIRQNLKPGEVKEKSGKKVPSTGRRMEKKEFACLDCGKHFPNKRSLLTHSRVHSEENPFHCPACGQNFENHEGFVAHQKNPACERPFSCSECGKRFKSRYNSEDHQKIHTENKKYLCPVCGKSFRKHSCFIVHERTHTGEKPYACPECGRCFSQNASLISHQRLHTGEKPFTCRECGRNFTQRISLVVHQRVHSGDRPYQCQECGKGFTQRIGLVQHQRRHTGEKPFTCSECGKSFTLHDSLVKHLRTHTGEKPYICLECGKRFCQSSQLTAHKRFHHATTPERARSVLVTPEVQFS